MKHLLFFLVCCVIFNVVFSQVPTKSKKIKVNGVELYYETYGKGEPLLMLHGYTQSSIAWKEFVEYYSSDYEVYLIDLRGHGKSSPFAQKFSVEAATKDILGFIEALKLEKIKGIGFSFGGDVLLQLSCLRPDIVESLVTIGSNANWNAQDYPEMLEAFTYENIEDFAWIRDFHANGEMQVKSVIEQLANYKIKLSDEELQRVEASALLILGDREQITIQSVVDLHRKLKHSAVWIIPNTGHSAHTNQNKQEFVRISKEFLSSDKLK